MLPIFAFVACSDDDEFDYDMNQLVGTWAITDVDTGNGYIKWPFEKTSATFNSDGSYAGKGYFGNGSGTYKAEGKTITCFIDGEEYMRYEILQLSGNTCELRMYEIGSDENIKVKCSKE